MTAKLFLCLALLAAAYSGALGRSLHQSGGSCPNTVWSLINSSPDLSTLKEAVEAAGLRATLDDPRLVATVFAPTNNAVERTLRDGGASKEQLLQNRQLLAAILSNHIVPGRAFKAADLKQGLRFKTLQGGEIGIDSAGIEQEEKYAGCNYLDIHIDSFIDEDAEPLQCDLEACQARVHTMDYMLIPGPETGVANLLPKAQLKSVLAGR